MDRRPPCISCEINLNRSNNRLRRSNVLSAEYVQEHPFLLDYLVEVRNIRQIAHGDRICRPCFQRARRFIEQRQADAAVQDVAGVEQDAAGVEHVVHVEQDVVNAEQDVVNAEQDVVNAEQDVVNAEQNQIDAVERAQPTQNDSRFPIPGFSRAPYNTRRCIFEDCHHENLIRIDKTLRAIILQEKSFYIPLGVLVCEQHRFDHAWTDISSTVRHVYNVFTPRQVGDMLRLLQNKRFFLNFERLASIPDDVFQYYIGFSKAQFTEVLEGTPTISLTQKKPATALATFLVKLHTGEPNQRLSKIFKMARSTFEEKMNRAREALLLEFVPRHLGYDHITREEVISRCLAIPNALFGARGEERAITIHDGTYIYLQRSTNYFFQRKSYSLHKWRQLYKPYLIVCPDGHIIDIYGPYDAITSDATILKGMIQRREDPFHWFYRTNDVFILDRGFRDALDELESSGYIAKVPISSSTRGTPLSTQAANKSRMVTMCRWVVETINGRLKNQFKLIRHTANNRALGHLFKEIKIAGSLLNAFGRPLTNHRLVEEILREINTRSNLENFLSEYVIAKNINARRAIFLTMTANHSTVDDFPQLTMDELIIYALGTYQIKQARSYYGEQIKEDGSYKIEVCREMALEELGQFNILATNPWLLRGRIQSRHRQARIYYTYILVQGGMIGRQAIHSHYCSCVIGKRTLGCCSHVMSVLWYLGSGRHQENLSPPATMLDNIIIRHDVENEADESSDEEL